LTKKRHAIWDECPPRKSNALTVMIKSLVFAGRVSCCNCRALHITGPELAILKMKVYLGLRWFSCKTQTSPKIDELGESITSKAKHQQATQRAKGVSLLY